MDRTAELDGTSNSQLLNENERLRMALESALDENSRLAEDRDRLLRRVTLLSREVRAFHDAGSQAPTQPPAAHAEGDEGQRQTEEELRVTLEELQVLTEELEVTNVNLHETNRELGSRVAEWTRQISDINAALRGTEGSLRTIADLVPGLLWRADARASPIGAISDGRLSRGRISMIARKMVIGLRLSTRTTAPAPAKPGARR